jgi:hypothetical protein
MSREITGNLPDSWSSGRYPVAQYPIVSGLQAAIPYGPDQGIFSR